MLTICTKSQSIWKYRVYTYCILPIYTDSHFLTIRARNLLIGFPSESPAFCPKMSNWAIPSKTRTNHSFAHFWWATWAICSQSLISSERCERIAHGGSFLVSNLSDLLISLIFGERPELLAHIAQRKWAIVSESLILLTKKRKWAKMSDSLIFNNFF